MRRATSPCRRSRSPNRSFFLDRLTAWLLPAAPPFGTVVCALPSACMIETPSSRSMTQAKQNGIPLPSEMRHATPLPSSRGGQESNRNQAPIKHESSANHTTTAQKPGTDPSRCKRKPCANPARTFHQSIADQARVSRNPSASLPSFNHKPSGRFPQTFCVPCANLANCRQNACASGHHGSVNFRQPPEISR